jgi:hypothetical protein
LQVVDTFDVSAQLGHATTWDVAEAKPGWVFVSANPSSSGIARIALIRRDLGNATSVVASNRIIRAEPRFHEVPLQQFLYVGESFSPESLYKLDLAQPTAPIVLEDVHGSVSGTLNADVGFDGCRIYLRSGQVLDTATLGQVGSIGSGISRLNGNATRAYVMTSQTTLTVFDTVTQLPVATQAMPCPPSPFYTIADLWLSSNETTALALVDNLICGVTTTPVPAIAGIAPSRARHDAGAVNVTITGGSLNLGGAVQVTVGGAAATNVAVINARTLTCTVPAGALGFKDVMVTHGNGSATLAAGFAHTPAMRAQGSHVPGGSIDYSILNTPGDLIVAYLSPGPVIAVTVPGVVGTLCLPGPVHLFSAPGLPFPSLSVGLPIPNVPGLAGLEVFGQCLMLSQGALQPVLTNCAAVTIR